MLVFKELSKGYSLKMVSCLVIIALLWDGEINVQVHFVFRVYKTHPSWVKICSTSDETALVRTKAFRIYWVGKQGPSINVANMSVDLAGLDKP